MQNGSPPLLSTFVAVVLGTVLVVMSIAFVSIPLALGSHPGEPGVKSARPVFHPT